MGDKFWYVYILRSLSESDRHYVGMSKDLQQRLERHSAGLVPHTSKHTPWQIETAIAFRLKDKPVTFEKCLKSHSGRAFAKKRL